MVSSFSPPSTDVTVNVVLLDVSGRNCLRKLDRSLVLANDCTKLLTAIVFEVCVAGSVGML